MIETRTSGRVAAMLGVLASIQLLVVSMAVSEIHELIAGLGAELPLPARAGLMLFRYPVLPVAAVVPFFFVAGKARLSTTFSIFVAAWLLSVFGGATVFWALWLLNHVLAGSVR